MPNSILPPNIYVDTDANVYTGFGALKQVTVSNGAGAGGQFILYDNTTAAGHRLIDATIPAGTTTAFEYGDRIGKPFKTGLYADVAASMVAQIVLT